MQYVAGMVTRIHKRAPARLYLREHRKAKGLSAEQVAGRMDMERESVLRLERLAFQRATPEKLAAYASAVGLDDWRALQRPPHTPSLDDLVNSAPAEIQAMAADIVRRLVAGGKG